MLPPPRVAFYENLHLSLPESSHGRHVGSQRQEVVRGHRKPDPRGLGVLPGGLAAAAEPAQGPRGHPRSAPG